MTNKQCEHEICKWKEYGGEMYLVCEYCVETQRTETIEEYKKHHNV